VVGGSIRRPAVASAHGPEPAVGGEVGMGRVRWEYRIINIRSENYRLDPNYEQRLNDEGDDGWELVSITAINFKTGATDHIGMVFKRPKS
jgi:hypothetical protein